jgi:hypothetical protein
VVHQRYVAHVLRDVHLVAGLDEALPRAEDLLRAPVLGNAGELELPLCDGDERRAGVSVPARMAAYVDRYRLHDHVCPIRQTSFDLP